MEINLQELDDSIPYVELQKNKLCINESAKILLNAEAGDRISINYWTVNNQYTFPVIGFGSLFPDVAPLLSNVTVIEYL